MLIYRAFLESVEGRTIAIVPISHRYKLQIDCGVRLPEELKGFLQTKISEQLNILANRGVLLELPSEINSIENPSALSVEIPVNYRLKRRPFEKTLPVIGHICNALAIFCIGIVSYLAMRVTTGNQNDAAKVGNFIGALFTLFITFLIYVFSGASSGLASMGKKIDGLYVSDSRINHNYNVMDEGTTLVDATVRILPIVSVAQTKSSTRKTLEGLGAGAAVMINAGITGITTFQQVKALGRSAVNPDEVLLYKIQMILPFVLVISAGISNPAFQWSFIRDAIASLISKLSGCCHQANDGAVLPVTPSAQYGSPMAEESSSKDGLLFSAVAQSRNNIRS